MLLNSFVLVRYHSCRMVFYHIIQRSQQIAWIPKAEIGNGLKVHSSLIAMQPMPPYHLLLSQSLLSQLRKDVYGHYSQA